MAELPIQ